MGPASKLKNKNKLKKQQQAASSSCDGVPTAAAAAAGSGDLAALILARLPIRKLVQCGTVCKLWREMTNNPSVRRASLARDRSWLVLHKRGWSRNGGDRLVAYSPAGGSWFELGSLASLLRGARWRRPDHAASAAGLVCCAYGGAREQQAAVAVFNPLSIGAGRRLLFLTCSITAFEAVAMWGPDVRDDPSCFGVVVAGPVSMWGSSWEVCVFNSRTGSWTRSSTGVDAITGRGFLSLMCSVVAASSCGDRGLFCIWGTSSVPQMITSYSIGLASWTTVHDFFPFSWQCVAYRLGKWRFKVQVRPSLLHCGGRLVSISLNDETMPKGLQVWQLTMNAGEIASWIELSAMPEEIWKACCTEIGTSSNSDIECSLHVRAVGSGDLMYVVLDWGWKIRVLLHNLRSSSWEWLPDAVEERFSCRIDNCMLSFDPNTEALPRL